jgi:hypothetical protein
MRPTPQLVSGPSPLCCSAAAAALKAPVSFFCIPSRLHKFMQFAPLNAMKAVTHSCRHCRGISIQHPHSDHPEAEPFKRPPIFLFTCSEVRAAAEDHCDLFVWALEAIKKNEKENNGAGDGWEPDHKWTFEGYFYEAALREYETCPPVLLCRWAREGRISFWPGIGAWLGLLADQGALYLSAESLLEPRYCY